MKGAITMSDAKQDITLLQERLNAQFADLGFNMDVDIDKHTLYITPAIKGEHLKELVAQIDPNCVVRRISEDDSKTTALIYFLRAHIAVEFFAGFHMDISEVEEDLGIAWAEVGDWYIKWMTLHITMKNGDVKEYDLTDQFDPLYDIDFKRPRSANVVHI
jgi:hypothetical protein